MLVLFYSAFSGEWGRDEGTEAVVGSVEKDADVDQM
jgi:hypothetical protein